MYNFSVERRPLEDAPTDWSKVSDHHEMNDAKLTALTISAEAAHTAAIRIVDADTREVLATYIDAQGWD